MEINLQPDAAGAGAEVIKNSSTAEFTKDVIEASQEVPVIVDFWAPWCGPCKQLTPVIEKVVRGYAGKVRLVKINVDQNQAIAGQLQVRSIPTVYMFRHGQPVDGFAGAQPESAIKKMIDKHVAEDLQTSISDVLETGDELLEAGDLQSAVEVFAAVLQEDQSNVDALAGLARCYLQSGDSDRARQTLELVPPEKRNNVRVESVVAALALAEKSTDSSEITALRQTVEADPADLQARFDLAVGLAAGQDREEGMHLLLDLIKYNRDWNDDAARKQLIELFEAWGPKEPLVLEGRRKLSAILFS